MHFYIIGAESNQKALFVKKSPFGEILRYPEFFRDQSKIQEVMRIQSYLRKKSINQKLGFAISLEPLVRFVRNFGFKKQFLQGLFAKRCAKLIRAPTTELLRKQIWHLLKVTQIN